MTEPTYRQSDADELHRVASALFGGWERRADDTAGDRVPGVLERLERLELVIKYGVAAAGLVGAGLGSLVTILAQHYLK